MCAPSWPAATLLLGRRAVPRKCAKIDHATRTIRLYDAWALRSTTIRRYAPSWHTHLNAGSRIPVIACLRCRRRDEGCARRHSRPRREHQSWTPCGVLYSLAGTGQHLDGTIGQTMGRSAYKSSTTTHDLRTQLGVAVVAHKPPKPAGRSPGVSRPRCDAGPRGPPPRCHYRRSDGGSGRVDRRWKLREVRPWEIALRARASTWRHSIISISTQRTVVALAGGLANQLWRFGRSHRAASSVG